MLRSPRLASEYRAARSSMTTSVALLNLGVLIVTGHPWVVTWAFTLWGAKMAAVLGWDSQSSPFWNTDYRLDMLHASCVCR